MHKTRKEFKCEQYWMELNITLNLVLMVDINEFAEVNDIYKGISIMFFRIF